MASVNPAPLIASSRSSSASCPPNVLTSACTRCGRVAGLGNVCNLCGSCAVGGPRPGATVATDPSNPSTVKQYSTRLVNCIACRAPLRVPSRCQTTYILCSPCQALDAAIVKSDPRARTTPRANPYPVVPPITKTSCGLPLTLAFTYPGLPAPPPTSASPSGRVYAGVNRHEDAPRVCVRFGCGARLPAHVLGDKCVACAARPPLPVVQKRVPRRVMERTCPRPRESLESVRASLSQGAVHGAEVAAQGKDVENELELIYPDDTPAATQYTSAAPVSKREESKPTEDEDAELELVYPEDAENTTSTSSSKPQTKSSRPTTLHELFKDGLRIIPALQNPAALADKNPPRCCRMPGCNEALPAQTCMQRCIKCTIGNWKQRKLAARHILDLPRGPSTSSLMTGTSMEEKEVTDMLDDMSDVEDGSALPLSAPSCSSGKGSSNELTDDHGVSSILGRDNGFVELSRCSEVENMTDSGPNPDLRLASPHERTGLRICTPLLATHPPPGSLPGKCDNKRCNITLPKDHRWKTCESCRRASRITFENDRRRMVDVEKSKSADLSCRRWRSLSPGVCEADTRLTPETSSCRARARREARQIRDALLETQHTSCQPEIVPRVPAYQNRGTLLSSFDAQLKRFVEGQVTYLRTKLRDSGGGSRTESEPWKPEDTSTTFVFMGEYSIVTSQRGNREKSLHDRDHSRWPDKPIELDAMRQEVLNIVLDLEGVLRTKFRAGEAFAIDKGGIIMQFTCSHQLIAQLCPLVAPVGPVPSSTSSTKANASKGEDAQSAVKRPPTVPSVQTFSSELETVVVPDESHRLFHGRRTVVRYRMVG